MSFEGYVVEFGDLEVDMESYFGKLAPTVTTYNSADKSYTIKNAAQVKTLSEGFTKLTLDFSCNSEEKYARYKVNDVAISTTKEEGMSVVEVNGRRFKVEDKELDAEKIGQITLDDKITFSGTVIKYDGLETTYAFKLLARLKQSPARQEVMLSTARVSRIKFLRAMPLKLSPTKTTSKFRLAISQSR